MKKSLITTIMLLCFITTCYTQESRFLGNWKLNVTKSIGLMDSGAKARYDSLSDEIKSRATAAMEGREFIFKDNHSITVNWRSRGVDRKSDGEWFYDPDKRTIEVRVNSSTEIFEIEFLNEESLVLKNKNKAGVFSTLFMTKQ